uniref:Annexin n=1 Tax=Felis catus TaxID=9685 RepID=A0ABI7Y8M0_FELCA
MAFNVLRSLAEHLASFPFYRWENRGPERQFLNERSQSKLLAEAGLESMSFDAQGSKRLQSGDQELWASALTRSASLRSWLLGPMSRSTSWWQHTKMPTSETWRLTSLATPLATSRRCSWSCSSSEDKRKSQWAGPYDSLSPSRCFGFDEVAAGTREADDVVSEDLVQQDVQDLYEAGELKWGTDEAQFIYILGNRSKQHLRLVFDEYLKTTGKPIEASIRGELSGDFEKLMLAVVKCIRSTPEYFAERLFKAMKGLGTRDNTLIRIMVSRSELDMLDIREIFRTKYEKSLYSMIKNDTSGEYKRALLKLCGGDDDAAGQFFPEAAQVAYQMWELSAVARVELKGTVRPADNFNPDADAKALRKAMKGLGTDEDTIIDIITHRSNAQRQQIRQTFKSHFGRDLMADLKSEISGDLARLILGLMMPPAHYDAKQLKKAMEGAGTDEKALIEILATRTNAEIRAICEAYKEDYHKSLEDALSSDTSGHFKRILVSLATGNREEGGEDRDQAREDAQVAAEILEIADTPSGDKTSLETRFMTILCTRSYQHLRRVFQEFVKMTNYDVEHTIKKEMSGDVRDVFVAIVQSVKNKPLFFADKLYKSMKGAGTDEKTLTRIMISRSEIDLLNIRREFIEKYDKSLHQAIEGDTSGDFLKALLAICGGED